jgi:hypothetical protein
MKNLEIWAVDLKDGLQRRKEPKLGHKIGKAQLRRHKAVIEVYPALAEETRKGSLNQLYLVLELHQNKSS